jgi:hypothetical protein
MAATGTPAGVGELTVLLTSWRLHLEAANLSARTIQAYTDDGALFARSLADKGMPTAADSIRGEHVEALDDQGSWRGGGGFPTCIRTSYAIRSGTTGWPTAVPRVTSCDLLAGSLVRCSAATRRARPTSAADERARDAHRRLSPGDRF